MAPITTDPKIILIAFLGGVVPSLMWLWFWLKEDEDYPEPKGLLTIVFIMGLLSVMAVYPIQKYINLHVSAPSAKLVLWATAEEFIKYLAVFLILRKASRQVDEPIDWPIYLITAALGFATLENTLYMLRPIVLSGTTISLLTGQLRFLGSTLLHTIASGSVGIALGLSFYKGRMTRQFFLFAGFLAAVSLHSTFNFFIIRNEGSDYLKVFAFLWVTAIIVMLLFEKVRRLCR